MANLDRRRVLQSAALGAAALVCAPRIVRAAAATPIRIGYLHVVSVDAQIWLGDHLGSWQKAGLKPEMREFFDGISLFQALVGGAVDVLTTGGVLSNFPARGQGEVFLINDVEWATGQIWAYPSAGINKIADLKGKKIATTLGTTAHDLVYHALKSVGLTVKDVQLVNQKMPDAVAAFIAGAVPAVATWTPFDFSIKEHAKGAKLVASAGSFPDASIVDGWAAGNDFYANHKDVLKQLIQAWIPANDFLVATPDEALRVLHDKYYPKLPLAEVREMHKVTHWYSAKQWVKYYKNGDVTKWLNRVTDFNVAVGAMQNPLHAQQYFDPSIYLSVVSA